MRLDYDELETIVQKYQEGDPEATIILIDAFRAFISKFQRLICFGQFSIHDRSLRNFISLFIKDNKQSRVHQFKYIPSARYEMYKTTQMIKDYFNDQTPEDIEQELLMAVLIMARRYKTGSAIPSFHLYMAKVFHFQIYRQLKRISAKSSMSLSENNIEGDESIDVDKFIDEESYITVEDQLEDQLGDNWVNGFTCSELFFELTSLERKILCWYYVNGHSDQEIADKVGQHRVTMTRRRHAIRDKVANGYKKGNNMH